MSSSPASPEPHKVSIIIPIYNAEKTISRCLDSVLSQTYKNTEIIAVNDGSTDGTLDILQQYSSKIQIITTENYGVAHARNIGLDHASGDFIFFVDSDDYICSEALATLSKNNDYDVVCGKFSCNMVYNKDKIAGIYHKIDALQELLLHQRITGHLHGKLYKKSAIQNIKFDNKTIVGEDLQFNYNVFKNDISICIVDDLVYHYTVDREDSLTLSPFCEKNMTLIQVYQDILSTVDDNLKTLAYKKYGESLVSNMSLMLLTNPQKHFFKTYKGLLFRNFPLFIKQVKTQHKILIPIYAGGFHVSLFATKALYKTKQVISNLKRRYR